MAAQIQKKQILEPGRLLKRHSNMFTSPILPSSKWIQLSKSKVASTLLYSCVEMTGKKQFYSLKITMSFGSKTSRHHISLQLLTLII